MYNERTPNRFKKRDKNNLMLGISQGDVNGIGYEVMIKCFYDSRMMEHCTPILYGSSKVLSYHKKLANASDFPFVNIRYASQAEANKFNILNIIQEEIKLDIGQPTEIGGKLAAMSLDLACDDLMAGKFDALVTNPINKKAVQSEDFKFNGHTEFLTKKFQVEDSLMIMTSNKIHIGIMTNHLAIADVPKAVTRDLLRRKLNIFNESLKRDFGIRMPKIAVLALNPHAGDLGVNGDEDQTLIAPIIKELFDNGILVFGPYPADGFFGSSAINNFDGVLALYHDQGLIPFKLISFTEGVNFTAGLPFVRTSPAHGTAYEIAGKNIASAHSFRNAAFLACDIVKNRREYDTLSSNTLQISRKDNGVDEDITKELQKDDGPNL